MDDVYLILTRGGGGRVYLESPAHTSLKSALQHGEALKDSSGLVVGPLPVIAQFFPRMAQFASKDIHDEYAREGE